MPISDIIAAGGGKPASSGTSAIVAMLERKNCDPTTVRQIQRLAGIVSSAFGADPAPREHATPGCGPRPAADG